MIILKRARMEMSESEHSSTKSAHARLVTNITLIVFLVLLWKTMMRTNTLPMSPSKDTTDVSTNSIHHFAPLDIIDTQKFAAKLKSNPLSQVVCRQSP